MFLIRNDIIKRNAGSDTTWGYLDIERFNEKAVFHTGYYFHLGSTGHIETDNGDWHPFNLEGPRGQVRTLEIKPGQNAQIWSDENFLLSNRVMAMFGQKTEFGVDEGFELIHGPTIDPGYRGPLKMIARNISKRSQHLRHGQRIGKIIFFDITETDADRSSGPVILSRSPEDDGPMT